MRDGSTLIFVFLGSVFFWIVKGFRTKFSDEFSGVRDNDYKFYRNLITGCALVALIALVVRMLLIASK